MELYHQVSDRNMLIVYISYMFALFVLTAHFCCVLIGWTDELKEGTLIVFKLEVFKTGPEICLSLTVYKDFSWILTYRTQCIEQEFCSLLKDFPAEINTGMLLNNNGKF